MLTILIKTYIRLYLKMITFTSSRFSEMAMYMLHLNINLHIASGDIRVLAENTAVSISLPLNKTVACTIRLMENVKRLS